MKYLIALLALAGIVVSVLALRVHNQDPSQTPPCAITEKFDCGAVNHSRYAVFPARTFDEDPGSHKLHILQTRLSPWLSTRPPLPASQLTEKP